MAEMLEIVVILKVVILLSFVIIDEFGCGMSIYDGFGFVWVISEYIVNEI